MTKNEIKHIERVFGKPISQIRELDIPTFIRNRDNAIRDEELSHEDDERYKYKDMPGKE